LSSFYVDYLYHKIRYKTNALFCFKGRFYFVLKAVMKSKKFLNLDLLDRRFDFFWFIKLIGKSC